MPSAFLFILVLSLMTSCEKETFINSEDVEAKAAIETLPLEGSPMQTLMPHYYLDREETTQTDIGSGMQTPGTPAELTIDNDGKPLRGGRMQTAGTPAELAVDDRDKPLKGSAPQQIRKSGN